MKMEPIVSSETSAIRTQTPGNYPKRNKLHLQSWRTQVRMLNKRNLSATQKNSVLCISLTGSLHCLSFPMTQLFLSVILNVLLLRHTMFHSPILYTLQTKWNINFIVIIVKGVTARIIPTSHLSHGVDNHVQCQSVSPPTVLLEVLHWQQSVTQWSTWSSSEN